MTHTILARDQENGLVGAAIASAVPASGGLCLRWDSKVGIASTQAMVNPILGDSFFDTIGDSEGSRERFEIALRSDTNSSVRQVGFVPFSGEPIAFTGEDCIPSVGEVVAHDTVVIGNMLASATVASAMSEKFHSLQNLQFAERLLASLEAGQHEGGDYRGKQSCAIAVINSNGIREVDLRVDNSMDPIGELWDLLAVFRAQCDPFVQSMPHRLDPGRSTPSEVLDVLSKAPNER